MPLLPQDQQLIDFLQEQHGVEITEEDLNTLAAFHFELATKRQERLATNPIPLPDVQNIPIAAAVVVGAIAGFSASAIGISVLTAVMIGASIGFSLGSIIEQQMKRKKQAQADEQKEVESRRTYGIDAVSGLVTLGESVPLIFGNRNINRNGGVRTAGLLINSRVDTWNGSQRLFELYCLSLGRLGAIDEDELLIDKQGRDTFFDQEIKSYVKYGSQGQQPIAKFPVYSQAVSLNSTTFVGCDLRSEVKSAVGRQSATIVDIDFIRNGIDTGRTTSDVIKNGGNYMVATSKQTIPEGKNGAVQMTVMKRGFKQELGVTAIRDPNDNNLPMSIRLNPDNHWQVVENGDVKWTSAGEYERNDVFTLEYLGPNVIYRRNGVQFFSTQHAKVYPAKLVVRIFDTPDKDADSVRIRDLRLISKKLSSKGQINPSGGVTITIDDDDIDKFSLSDVYRTAGGTDFRIVSKVDHGSNGALTTDGPVDLGEDDDIYAVWKATLETSKKVDQIDVNLVGRLFARNEDGEMTRQGQVFDVYLKGVGSGSGWQFLTRLYMSNKNENDVRRSFSILNLPYGKYKVELRPRIVTGDGETIYKLGDTGEERTWNSGVTIGGKQVKIRAEIADTPDAEDIEDAVGFDDKPVVSTSQGAPIRITTINEIVTAGPPAAYPGFALFGLEYVASERISAAPTPSFLITEGFVDKLHIAAGTCQQTYDLTMVDNNSGDFLAKGVQTGDILRNLDKHVQSPITGLGSNAIATSGNLYWGAGDRYLVYREGSSCYFPDIFATLLSHPEGGLGGLFDADEFIDYVSIVKAREFCIRRNFYFDGAITGSTPFGQWATQEAPNSLLFPSRIDGRFALVPEEESAPVMMFNASNMTDYTEEYVDWSDSQVNRIVVTYTDGSDDFVEKTVVIQTVELFRGDDIPFEESLRLSSVTNRQQAIAIGALAIKSRKLQDRAIQFKTGLQGCYLRPGDLILVQHLSTEWNFEKSGFVEGVFEYVNGAQCFKPSVPVAQTNDPDLQGALLYKNSGNIKTGLGVVINDPATSGYPVCFFGMNEQISPGDAFILGEDIEARRTYRVANINPNEDGSITINAAYWTKDMLTLDGLVVDDVCYGANRLNAFNVSEMQGWLSNMAGWLSTYTRSPNNPPLAMNTDYLLANAFHTVMGRGGYFPPQSGTSEGQFIMIKACALAYQITGNTTYRDIAITMGNAAVARLYLSGTIPNDPNSGLWTPHWLFNMKTPFPTKGKIAPDYQNYGYFDVVVNFSNGEGTIPAGGSTNGQYLSDVYAVYSTDGKLLWQNVYAPVKFGVEYEVNYWVSNLMLLGTNYRTYPTTASSSGTAPTVTSETAGKIKLNSPYTGQLKVTYAAYEPGVQIGTNEKFEAYPVWRRLFSGEAGCALDTLPWACEGYELLSQLTGDGKWMRAYYATIRALNVSSQIPNLTHYYKKMDTSDPFSYPGSQLILINHPAGTVPATSRVNGGALDQFLRAVIPDSPIAYSSAEVQNFAVVTRMESDNGVQIEFATTAAGVYEIGLSLSADAFDFSKVYSAYLLMSAGTTAATGKTFKMGDFIKWRNEPTGDILWHPTQGDNPIYTYSGGGGTVSITRNQVTLNNYNPVVWDIELDSGTGYAGAGLLVSIGAQTTNPPMIYLKHEGDSAILRVTDSDGVKWDVGIDDTDGDWEYFYEDWDSYQYSSVNSGDGGKPASGNIQSVEIVANGSHTTQVYYAGKLPTTRPMRLPTPCTVYKASIVSRIQPQHTIYVGTFKPTKNALDNLLYSPGVIPFTVNTVDGNIDAWRGVPYSGYQAPFIWVKTGDNARLKQCLEFLRDAQNAYTEQHPSRLEGPYAPVFSWTYWDAGDFTANGINGFGWNGPDPNTEWCGYQYRPLCETAKAWMMNPSLSLAEENVMKFLTYLKNLYDARNSGQPPTNFPKGADPQILYHEPHAASLIMMAAIFANIAGGEPDITFNVIVRCYDYLKSQYVSSGPMLGSFTAGQPTFSVGNIIYRENFSFWVGVQIEAISALLKYRDQLRYPCS